MNLANPVRVAWLAIGVAVLSSCSAAGGPAPTPHDRAGWVVLEFDIDPQGAVKNPRVVRSEPPGVFDSIALATIVKWRYEPPIENGKAVWRRKTQVVLEFRP